jgi:SAM-dependent methyltransferase
MSSSTREFSSDKHRRGEWNTRIVRGGNPIVRACCRYMSFKRALVDDLARTVSKQSLVLDLGCGNGAYGVWFGGRTDALVISLDWSFDALRSVRKRQPAPAVCADATNLPFKSEVFGAAYSIDTLGHVGDIAAALNELLRTVVPGGRLAIHTECSDNQARWPHRQLIAALGSDTGAALDGHVSVWSSKKLREAFSRRFVLRALHSPAGYLGWLTGYPEKYLPAMIRAGWWPLLPLVWVFSFVKKIPILGWFLRLANITTNHLELALGLDGGGSCFAIMEKPSHTAEGPAHRS